VTQREGHEEGDELDLFLPSKETLPGKETSEVDAELHPVNWYHPAYRNQLPFLYRSHPVANYLYCPFRRV